MSKTHVFLVTVLLATLCMPTAQSAQSLGLNKQAAPKAATPYHFLESVIRCLSQAHDAIAEINAQKNDDFFGKMVALKNARFEFTIASQRVEPFVESDVENIKISSGAIVQALGIIRDSLGKQLAVYEQLNVATTVEQLVATRGPMSDAAVMYRQSSSILRDAAVIVVGSAIVPDTEAPEHVALMMSAGEKAALIKMLKSGFGGKLAASKDNDGPTSAAAVMLNALQQDWRLVK